MIEFNNFHLFSSKNIPTCYKKTTLYGSLIKRLADFCFVAILVIQLKLCYWKFSVWMDFSARWCHFRRTESICGYWKLIDQSIVERIEWRGKLMINGREFESRKIISSSEVWYKFFFNYIRNNKRKSLRNLNQIYFAEIRELHWLRIRFPWIKIIFTSNFNLILLPQCNHKNWIDKKTRPINWPQLKSS